MNQAELSGFLIPIILTYLSNTGNLSGVFYPLLNNPSGYLQSGAFISQVDLDSAITQALSFVSNNFYPDSNPSGFLRASDITHATNSFLVNCSSGVDTQFVNFPFPFTGIPNINCSFLNNIDNNIYYFGISGVNTTGFYVNYSDTVAKTGYKLSVITDL